VKDKKDQIIQIEEEIIGKEWDGLWNEENEAQKVELQNQKKSLQEECTQMQETIQLNESRLNKVQDQHT
jgi:hypothetical protein